MLVGACLGNRDGCCRRGCAEEEMPGNSVNLARRQPFWPRMRWIATFSALMFILALGWSLKTPMGWEVAPPVETVEITPEDESALSVEPDLLTPTGPETREERLPVAEAAATPETPTPMVPVAVVFNGRVLSDTDGHPVAEIVVEVAGRRPGGTGQAEIAADDDGTFIVRHAPPAGLPLAVRAPGYAPVLFLSDAVHDAPERAAEIRLGPAATLTARVVDALGTGMAGVQVRLSAEALDLRFSSDLLDLPYDFDAPEWSAETDLHGTAVLVDLPPAVMLTAELSRDGETLLRATEPLTLTPGRREIVWSIGTGTLVTGRVRTEAGTAVAGVEVWRLNAGADMAMVFRPDMGTSVAAKARTDEDGVFAMPDVAEGAWRIGLAPSAEYASVAEYLKVERSAVVTEVDLAAHAHLTIAGKVVGPEGQPVANARIVANQAGTLIYLTADISNSDGSFALGPAVPGAYEIGAGTGRGDLRSSENIIVQAGDQDVILAMRQGGAIRGRVVDALTREPTPAAIVCSAAGGGREFKGFQRILSHSVEFELGGLKLTDYYVVAHTADGRIGVGRSEARPLSEGRELLEVRVEPGAKLVIRSTGELGGSYQVWWGETIIAMNGLEAGGRIELTTPPGEVWVHWRPRGMREYITERRIHVSAGERREVPFDGE